MTAGEKEEKHLILTKMKRNNLGTTLAVQWLRLCTSTAGGAGSNPSRVTEIPHAVRPKKKKRKNLVHI